MHIKYILVLMMFLQILFAEETAELDDKCIKGDMYDCQKLGNVYKKAKEYKQSNYYFKLVCDNNISDGCMSVATYYDLNNRKYKKKAFKYYTKACVLNNRWACNNLGNFYRYGKIVDKNSSKAISLFEKAYCLGEMGKPYSNRKNTIDEYKLINYKKNDIDCISLNIDESMDTANQIDDESVYQ